MSRNRTRPRSLAVGALTVVTLAGGVGAVLASSSVAAPAGYAAAAPVGAGPVGAAPVIAAADPALAAQLAFAREEERLARELYQLFSDSYGGARPFSMIVRSEQRHVDAIGRLLVSYGIADPSAGRPAGSYADPQLQLLYDTWKAQGSSSELAAAQVGVELEKRDIADLEKAISQVTLADVKAVLERLLAGSRNHLAAYTAAATGQPTGSADGVCDGTGAGPGRAGGPGGMTGTGRMGGPAGIGGLGGQGRVGGGPRP
jgi:hypothetical protein